MKPSRKPHRPNRTLPQIAPKKESFPPNPPSKKEMVGWLVDPSIATNTDKSIDREPSNQPKSSFCERILDGPCVNHRPDHVLGSEHLRQLVDRLRYHGLGNADWIVRQSQLWTLAADYIAEQLEYDLAAGVDSLAQARNPGAVIHWRIRERVKQLSGS